MTEHQLDTVGHLARQDQATYADCVVDHLGRGGGAADIHLTVYRPQTVGAPDSAILRRWLITRHGEVFPLRTP